VTEITIWNVPTSCKWTCSIWPNSPLYSAVYRRSRWNPSKYAIQLKHNGIKHILTLSRQAISRDKLVQLISVQMSPHVLDLSQSTIHCLKAYEFRYRWVTVGFHLKCQYVTKNCINLHRLIVGFTILRAFALNFEVSTPLSRLWASKRDKIMNTHTIKSNTCKHYESSHM
jgi:hypothetical protein